MGSIVFMDARFMIKNNIEKNSIGFPKKNMAPIIQSTRIGITKAKDLPWRWYLQKSRSISKRAKGDRCPTLLEAWKPNAEKSS